jgi:hypothetical protein
MMEFKVSNIVPPGGRYFYEVPETRTYFEDLSEDRLIARLRRHFADNRIPWPGDMTARVRDFICRRVPPGFCRGDVGDGPTFKVYTTDMVRAATRRLVGPQVVQGLAQRRAEVCANCTQNDRTACPTCTGMVAWAQRYVGGKTTGIDQVLGICLVDGALIPAKVWFEFDGAGEHPVGCWRKS